MEKQTAVAFFIKSFTKYFGSGWLTDETIKEEIKKAKEIEKLQIEAAFNSGYRVGQSDYKSNLDISHFPDAKDYYRKTYNK